jgi:hypothetical protein
MSIVRWEDPPPNRFRWRLAADELREHPGQWACVIEKTDKTEATHAWRSLIGHGCEAVTRSIGSGFGVWARWPA